MYNSYTENGQSSSMQRCTNSGSTNSWPTFLKEEEKNKCYFSDGWKKSNCRPWQSALDNIGIQEKGRPATEKQPAKERAVRGRVPTARGILKSKYIFLRRTSHRSTKGTLGTFAVVGKVASDFFKRQIDGHRFSGEYWFSSQGLGGSW